MIIANAPQPVERIGSISTKTLDYTIHATQKAFEVLSSKLYKNKVRAIIRELSCNAHDSHVEAGNPNPFEVHLPTAFEPWFSVRDYGVGMSSTTVETVFTHFFRSTKEETNELIGALGLGAKAPFSLVDSFTVTTVHDGTRSVYTCYRENGLPKCDLNSSHPSNEPNGVEVSVPVRTQDFDTYRVNAMEVFRWFDNPPTILGRPLDITPLDRSQGWAIGSSGMIALMGQVAYPIDTQIVNNSRLRNVVLYFDIGELDVQAGREELSYDEMTIRNINSKIDIVNAHIQKTYEDDLKECKNIFQALKVVTNSKNPLYRNCSPEFNQVVISKLAITQAAKRYGQSATMITGDESEYVVFVDTCSRANAKYTEFRRTNKQAGLRIYKSSPTRSAIMKEFDNCKIVYSHEVKLTKKATQFRQMATIDIRNSPTISVTLDSEVVYIPTKNMEWTLGEEEWRHDANKKTAIISILKEISPQAKHIYIPWTMRNKIQPHWKNAHELIRNHYDSLKRDFSLEDQWRVINDAGMTSQFNHINHINAPNTKFQKVIDHIRACQAAYYKNCHWADYRHHIGVKPNNRAQTMWEKLREDYPLFDQLVRNTMKGQIIKPSLLYGELTPYIEGKERL